MSTSDPPPHPLDSPKYHADRSLFLEDWKTFVEPETVRAHGMVVHSVTYGSTALQAC